MHIRSEAGSPDTAKETGKSTGKAIEGENISHSRSMQSLYKTPLFQQSANGSKDLQVYQRLARMNIKHKKSRWQLRVGVSVIRFERHDSSVDDMVGGIAIRNIDPRVLPGSLGQSLLEAFLEGVGHVIDECLLDLLQLLDGRVSRGHLLLQSLLLNSEPVDLSLQLVMVNLEKTQCLGLGSHFLLHPL